MKNIQLSVKQIADTYIRDNFQRLADLLNREPVLKGDFQFKEITVDKATSGFLFPHNLGYTPKDTLVTSVIGPGTVTFNYDKFDGTNLNLTTTGAVVIRLFVGSYS